MGACVRARVRALTALAECLSHVVESWQLLQQRLLSQNVTDLSTNEQEK